MKLGTRTLAAALLALLPAIATAADRGIPDSQVRFAQVAAVDVPAAAAGIGMQLDLRAAFEVANVRGGVHCRKIILDSFDDGYEPDQSVAHVMSLIDGDRISDTAGDHERGHALYRTIHRRGESCAMRR